MFMSLVILEIKQKLFINVYYFYETKLTLPTVLNSPSLLSNIPRSSMKFLGQRLPQYSSTTRCDFIMEIKSARKYYLHFRMLFRNESSF